MVNVPAPALVKAPLPLIRAAVDHRGRVSKDERGIIADVAWQDAIVRHAIAHLQRAAGDRRAARIGIRAQERQHAGPDLGQTPVLNRSAEGDVAAAADLGARCCPYPPCC